MAAPCMLFGACHAMRYPLHVRETFPFSFYRLIVLGLFCIFFNLNLNVYTVVCVEHSLCLFVREVASSVDLMKIPHIDIYFHVACILQRNTCSCSKSCPSKQ